MRKITSSSLVLLLLFSIAQVTLPKPQGDWASLKNFVGQPIAIKTNDGVTSFGILGFVDDSLIKVQLADKEQLSSQETSFTRGEVTRIYSLWISVEIIKHAKEIAVQVEGCELMQLPWLRLRRGKDSCSGGVPDLVELINLLLAMEG